MKSQLIILIALSLGLSQGFYLPVNAAAKPAPKASPKADKIDLPKTAQPGPLITPKPMAVSGEQAKPSNRVDYQIIEQFAHSQIDTPFQQLLQSPAALRVYWSKHATPGLPMPEIDFRKQALLALHLGQQVTPGYAYCAKNIQISPTGLIIQTQLESPDPDRFYPMIRTQPGCLIRLDQQKSDRLTLNQPTLETERKPSQMRTLSLVTNSRIFEPRRVIARDLESFRQLWIEHTNQPEQMPEVDFKNEMVLGVFLGERPTGGYLIQIEKIETVNQRLQVHVSIQQPDPENMVIQMLTAPAHLILMPATDLPIDFIDQTKMLK